MAISVILVMVFYLGQVDSRQKRAEQEVLEQLHRLQLQFSPAQRDTIRDSVSVLTQQIIQMPSGEYKLYAADRQLLQDLNMRVNQVVADQRVTMVSEDTVKATRTNSVFAYDDAWLSLKLDTTDSVLTYRARDSLQTIIARQYKHKFLWWKWGTRGYDVKVINFNPHSTLLYNSYIQVTR